MVNQEHPVKKSIKNRWLWSILGLVLFLFIALNFIAASHAYNFTHFNTQMPEDGRMATSKVSVTQLFTEISLAKPINDPIDLDFIEIDTIHNTESIEIWHLDMEPSKGVVALFHGYRATKSTLWQEALAFYRMGYTVVLADFRGSGNSSGNTCTIGYYEAEDVKTTYAYCKEQFPNQKIYLYGSSMGAAAITRAVGELHINPSGILLQSSFATMLGAVQARFKLQGVPSFPSAHLITFWGGYLNDFYAFDHNPSDYASHIQCPTLIIHGMLDDRVSYEDALCIYNEISGPKEMAVFGKSGHESILNKEELNWIYFVTNFMETHPD